MIITYQLLIFLAKLYEHLNLKKFYSGMNTILWNGKNDFGRDLSTGVYFCRLKSKNIDQTKKNLVLKLAGIDYLRNKTIMR